MTADERVKAVVEFGFTERQARFLVTVILHSGVCLLRQYTAFAGIVHGQKTRKFFAKLVKHGDATAYPCRHNRGRVYHVQHKPLYRAIGETESRLRRPMSATRVVERLMLLDALLASPEVVWLATSEEQPAHVANLAGVGAEGAARLTVPTHASTRARGTRDEMPIGIDLNGRSVFAYAVTGDQLNDFHRFLQRHSSVLSTLPAWTLRVVFPSHLPWLGEQYQEHARQELAKPWPQLIERLKWYFQQRRAHTLGAASIDDRERYDEEHFCFRATRYQVLYQRWLNEGDSALEAVSSTATADAIKSGAGRIETHVLRFSYRHLSPLVAATRPTMKGAEEGDEAPTRPRPPVGSVRCAVDANAEVRARCTGDDAKRLRDEVLARAGSASRRDEGRRSLPPDNSSVGTAIGA